MSSVAIELQFNVNSSYVNLKFFNIKLYNCYQCVTTFYVLRKCIKHENTSIASREMKRNKVLEIRLSKYMAGRGIYFEYEKIKFVFKIISLCIKQSNFIEYFAGETIFQISISEKFFLIGLTTSVIFSEFY